MKEVLYEVILYANGSITPQTKTWHLFTKGLAETKKKPKKSIFVRYEQKKAA